MKITYCLSAANNALYNGKYALSGRYKTFGHHSFIIDFIACATRNGCSVDFLIEDKDKFPLYEYMLRYCRVAEFGADAPSLNDADVVIIDTLSEEGMRRVETDAKVYCLVHNAGSTFSDRYLTKCDKFICMTKTALLFQSTYIPGTKLLLWHQGVNLERFQPAADKKEEVGKGANLKILLYTRLNEEKKTTVLGVVQALTAPGHHYEVTVLGDGDFFWEISNTYGHAVTVMNHIPCNSIHTFLPKFDLIVSSARGVMEACACGVPAICAGFGYAGLINNDNIPGLMVRNLTGFGESKGIASIHQDIARAVQRPATYWRNLGLKYFDMQDFIVNMKNEVG